MTTGTPTAAPAANGGGPAAGDPVALTPSATPKNTGAGVAMVAGAVLSVQLGAAVAKLVFPLVGPSGVVLLRLVIAAVALGLIVRPRLTGRTRRDWLLAAVFGVVLAVMNLCFYQAVDRLPLGLAVTIELLGPLGLAVAMSRRAVELAWVGLAIVGVLLLGEGGQHLDPIGVMFALLAALCWAAYILLSAEAGRRFARVDGLAIAMVFAAVVAVPFGIASGGMTLLTPKVLLAAAAVALLSSVVNYSLELVALRSVPARTFGVLMSLSPVAATLAGFLVLGQRLGVVELVAITCVILASAGTVLGSARRPTDSSPPQPSPARLSPGS